jgi:hypothetical protein
MRRGAPRTWARPVYFTPPDTLTPSGDHIFLVRVLVSHGVEPLDHASLIGGTALGVAARPGSVTEKRQSLPRRDRGVGRSADTASTGRPLRCGSVGQKAARTDAFAGAASDGQGVAAARPRWRIAGSALSDAVANQGTVAAGLERGDPLDRVRGASRAPRTHPYGSGRRPAKPRSAR